MAGRKSNAELAIVAAGEKLVEQLREKAGFDRSIQDVLLEEDYFLGELSLLVQLIIDADIEIDDPILNLFFQTVEVEQKGTGRRAKVRTLRNPFTEE